MNTLFVGKILFLLVAFLLLSISLALPVVVSAEPGTAQTYDNSFGSGNPNPGGTLGNSNPGGSGSGGSSSLTNPLKGINSIAEFVQQLLRAVVAIGVPIAVLFIVLAGFKFITARGNSEALVQARTNFVHVVIGVAIFIGAWALAQLIVSTLRQIGANV